MSMYFPLLTVFLPIMTYLTILVKFARKFQDFSRLEDVADANDAVDVAGQNMCQTKRTPCDKSTKISQLQGFIP